MKEQTLKTLLKEQFDVFSEMIRGVVASQISEIVARIDENTKDIQDVQRTMDQLEKKYEVLHGVFNHFKSENMEVIRKTEKRCEDLELVSKHVRYQVSRSDTDNDTKRDLYDHSRRSLRVWPVTPTDKCNLKQATLRFLIEVLKLPEDFNAAKISQVKAIPSDKQPKATNEVLITFNDNTTRDFVRKHAKNLANQCTHQSSGMRIDFPDFLSNQFRLLERYGAYVRRLHGEGTRQHIRFDDQRMGLFSSVKLPKAEGWIKVSPELAEELLAKGEAENASEVKRRLSTTTVN